MLLNKNIKLILNYILGPLVFLFLSYSIYRQVLRQPDWRSSLDQVCQAITGPQQWRLWLVLALMPVNWGIEAWKWQLAMRPVMHLSYLNAFRAVLTGTTLASFTPNRIGEYLGRMLYIEEGRRISSISLTIVCSIAQLLITLAVGMAGILYLRWYLHGHAMPGRQSLLFWINILLGIASVLLVSLTIIYFRLSWFIRILERIPGAGKWLAHIKILESFNATVLSRILSLAFCRYLVFMLQYSLVFPVFGVFLGIWQVWGGVSVVFLIMAVVPTFTFLTELGLRWEAGIQVLELFSANALGIFAASFAIWLINLIIPALIGSLLILSIKLFKNR
ncbi:MAG TPA: lysylphosphatidylglycerol synthase domain-containing protein [Puia sp.]|nr:lysylphosphatidylglycerol synthase domain-containing protein [Puia sp.]